MMKFISLFSGIGGFDLGFERAGMECVAQVEFDEKASAVLAKHWPGVPRFKDVRDVGKHNLPAANVLCGGFPCQDVSLAGKRAGLDGERSTLWDEFARIICETEPRWVVAENVYGLLSSDDGRFFGRILRDLAACGLDATWQVLRASAFGAIHRRERVLLVAHRDGERVERFWQEPISRVAAFSWCQDIRGPQDLRNRPDIPFPLVRRKGDGVSCRVDQLGNAVVPQLIEWVGRRIVALETAVSE